jgi:acyl-CoA thioesterase-1
VRIVVIGDSNVAGTGVSAVDRYPEQLASALVRMGLRVEVENRGLNGERSADTANRAGWIGTDIDLVVYWQHCANDRRAGLTPEACRANNQRARAGLEAKGIATFAITPDHAQRSFHLDPRLTLAGEGRMIDFRDGSGLVPDRHLNRAGYARVVSATVNPIASRVREIQRRKGI